MSDTPAPIIVSVLFGSADFAHLDGLRRTHFPPERDVLPAHLTMFHHLPPSIEPELRQRLLAETRGVLAPQARMSGVFSLGRGVAIRIQSPALEDMRARLAEAFAPVLTPQDAANWRAHVTIQNKVTPEAAQMLLARMAGDFSPRPVTIAGLAVWRYLGGPWGLIDRYPFRR